MKNSTLNILLFLSISLLVKVTSAQPITKKYLMAYHTCDANCQSFADHMVQLAESDDGENWSLVPNFSSYQASVPDVITRGNKLYIYSPSGVKRYDKNTDKWDNDLKFVDILDGNNQPVQYVDPSAIIDDQGRIVLFFLNSTGSTTDPASCPSFPCTKYFDSAIEIDGSDGTRFRIQDGHRAEIELAQAPGFASDPDIFFDGTQYILYISQGNSTLAYHSDLLHGSYVPFSSIGGVLTHEGGVPCGYFDKSTNKYWSFVHGNDAGSTVIKRAVHSDFSVQPNNFTAVITASLIGDPGTTRSESPSICENTFLTVIGDQLNSKPNNFYLKQNFPNPFNPTTTINYSIAKPQYVKLNVFNSLGENVKVLVNEFKEVGSYQVHFDATNLTSGVYYYKIISGNNIEVKKMILLK